MPTNPFELAVKTVINRELTAKEYLMQVEGKTEQEAEAILADMLNPRD